MPKMSPIPESPPPSALMGNVGASGCAKRASGFSSSPGGPIMVLNMPRMFCTISAWSLNAVSMMNMRFLKYITTKTISATKSATEKASHIRSSI